jgi:hypothetical protein
MADDLDTTDTDALADEAKTLDDQQTETALDSEQAEDEVVVSIGEEPPPPEEQARAPDWVRELRKSHRDLQRRNRELEEKAKSVAVEQKPQVGKKPTLEDLDYDAERYEAALSSWYDQKRRADEVEGKAREAAAAQDRAWQAKLDSYGKAKAELKVRDFEDAEHFAQETFSVTQQGVMLQGAENPALVIYALGKNPTKAKELSSISDPVKFAFAVAKLEAQLKVTPRKAPPPPERAVRGTAPVSGTVDSALERLRDEAARTGNMSKVMEYRRQQKAKAK